MREGARVNLEFTRRKFIMIPPPPSLLSLLFTHWWSNVTRFTLRGLGAHIQGQRVGPSCGLAVTRCLLTAEDRLVLHRNPYGFLVDQVAGTWIRFCLCTQNVFCHVMSCHSTKAVCSFFNLLQTLYTVRIWHRYSNKKYTVCIYLHKHTVNKHNNIR